MSKGTGGRRTCSIAMDIASCVYFPHIEMTESLARWRHLHYHHPPLHYLICALRPSQSLSEGSRCAQQPLHKPHSTPLTCRIGGVHSRSMSHLHRPWPTTIPRCSQASASSGCLVPLPTQRLPTTTLESPSRRTWRTVIPVGTRFRRSTTSCAKRTLWCKLLTY